MKRQPARLGLARALSAVTPLRAAKVSPLELIKDAAPKLPDDEWVRLRPRLSGICGSDLATVDGHASTYFDPIVSFPFTLGHEIVADVIGTERRRVAVIPVLHCAVRGLDPVCEMCAAGHINLCEKVAFGHLDAGLQTGFCCSTGGGWSEGLVAHPLQLVDVPDDLDDDAAVIIEPTACAVHAATFHRGGSSAIIGAGTVGLLTLAAIEARRDPTTTPPVLIGARYPHQIAYAKQFGGVAVQAKELARRVRTQVGGMVIGDQLTTGVQQVFDCVGTSDSLQQALKIVAPGGEILVVGMPASVTLDLTGLWHREVAIRGCYAYRRDDFDTAIDLVRTAQLGRLVSAHYRLDDYADAIAHASSAGPRGAVKVVFDMREGAS
jgi:threonine dehydrogenase-like Zn-dependent dehydrogenase